jgi:GntR family transcriptional regulator
MDEANPSIEFRLNTRSGIPAYLQIVQQVRQALRLGLLVPGDQLPTVREVVSNIAINPNTVFKAYQKLEVEGLVESRPGLGTFIIHTLADDSLTYHDSLRLKLAEWIRESRTAGLGDESIEALFSSVLYDLEPEAQE